MPTGDALGDPVRAVGGATGGGEVDEPGRAAPPVGGGELGEPMRPCDGRLIGVENVPGGEVGGLVRDASELGSGVLRCGACGPERDDDELRCGVCGPVPGETDDDELRCGACGSVAGERDDDELRVWGPVPSDGGELGEFARCGV